MATQTVQPTAAEVEKSNRDAKVSARQKELDAENAKLEKAKGLRKFVGLTRGKNPQIVEWNAFDKDIPASLPTSLTEFVDLTKVADENVLVSLLVDGFNDSQYSAASDPTAEYMNPAWPDETQKQFRIIVRNYSSNTGVSLEDAVSLIKPGIEAAFQKTLAK